MFKINPSITFIYLDILAVTKKITSHPSRSIGPACSGGRKSTKNRRLRWILKEVILSVIQYICITGLMIVFIIKPILPVHVSSYVTQTIYACYRNTIKATMDLPSRIKPRRVKRCIVDDSIPPVHIRSLFPTTIYACDKNTI